MVKYKPVKMYCKSRPAIPGKEKSSSREMPNYQANSMAANEAHVSELGSVVC